MVRLEDVVILIATGTHRGNSEAELRAMLGDEVVDAVRIENHDARDERALRYLGRVGNDVPLWLNRTWLDADIRITTGFVEPHFFAGFSGGPKMIAPGLAGLETTLVLHDASRIGHAQARWGVLEGNPVHDDIRAIARHCPPDFSLDVVLDGKKRVARAFGGELFAMHQRCDRRRARLRDVPRSGRLRRRRDLERRLSARPEPLPGGQGDVGSRAGRQARRHDRDRRGVPRRVPRPRELPQRARRLAIARRLARSDRRTPADGRRSVADPDPGEDPGARTRARAHLVPLRRRSGGCAPRAGRRRVRCGARALAERGPDATVCALPWGPLAVPYISP